MRKKLYIGLNENFHDPSICVLNEAGEILFAEATERFFQYKMAIGCPADPDFLVERIFSHIDVKEIDELVVAYSWNRARHRSMKLLNVTGISNFDDNYWLRKWFRKKGVHYDSYQVINRTPASFAQAGVGLFVYFAKNHPQVKITKRYFTHHDTHAVNALHASAIDSALCVVIDGGGEKGGISVYEIQKGRLRLLLKDKSAYSLGSLYWIGTLLTGYSMLQGEAWKVMGMAAYGKNNSMLEKALKAVFRFENGKFKRSHVSSGVGHHLRYFSELIKENQIPREDIACTVQQVFEAIFFDLVNHSRKLLPGADHLFVSGGSALNSSAIGKLHELGWFKKIVVPNGPADDGNAIGAALLAHAQDFPQSPLWQSRNFRNPYCGADITAEAIEKYVQTSGLPFIKLEQPEHYAAELLHQNQIIGWIQGRAEFGPRALGNRSILAHPGYADNKDRINAVVKFRESYRPFAPSILHEHGAEYFEQYDFTPYMEKSLTFREEVRDKVPAVVHLNLTGRLQSVTEEINPKYYRLIRHFYSLSGIPMVVNTSYNVMGKPIVNDINDVMAVFFNSRIDAVFIGSYCLERKALHEKKQ